MEGSKNIPHKNLTPALEAIGNLTLRDLNDIFHSGQVAAMFAHDEIELAPINQKTGHFYRYFVPLRTNLVSLLAASYRRYFKLRLAHPSQAGHDPDKWAWDQLQPAVDAALEWIRDWYMLACDGENRYVQHTGSVPFVQGETVSISIPLTVPTLPPPKCWCAPAWLFQVSPTLGILLLRSEHVPANDSEEKLGPAHTRLLLKGARRSFLWELEVVIETVQNEEIAAAGAIPAEPVAGERRASQIRQPKGVEGLVHKTIDLSKYMDNLTEKQQLAFSLKFEYRLGLADIASRMGLNRKTAYEHIKAAERKIDQVRSSDKRKARTDSTPE